METSETRSRFLGTPSERNDTFREMYNAHQEWVSNIGGKRANFTLSNLTGVDLSDFGGLNLPRAFFHEASMIGMSLTHANLRGANLSEAHLSGTSLWNADLREANLRGADLTVANLCNADLTGADLTGARLSHTVIDARTRFSWNSKAKDLIVEILRRAALENEEKLQMVGFIALSRRLTVQEILARPSMRWAVDVLRNATDFEYERCRGVRRIAEAN